MSAMSDGTMNRWGHPAEVIARLECDLTALLAAAKDARTELALYYEGCDHSVGLCECSTKDALDALDVAIAAACGEA